MSVPVVLLHPLGSDARFWDPVLPELASGIDAVALDLPGHGTAPLVDDPASIRSWSAAVLEQLDRLGHERVVLVGISLGGLVAQHLAATAGDRVERVVLADTVAAYPEPMREMWRERAITSRAEGTASFVDPTLALWFTSDFRAGGGPVVAAAADGVAAAPPEGYARACELLAEVDLLDLLPQITCPTLVVCGEQDGSAFVQAAPRLAQTIPGASLRWLPGGHAAVVEHPREFAALVNDVLAPAATEGPS